MQTNYLLPNKYKNYGWILFLFGLVLGLLAMLEIISDDSLKLNVLSIFNDSFLGSDNTKLVAIINTGIVNEIAALSIMIGGLIIGFSKEKFEDEFISKLRTESFVWAMITNYIVLIITTIFIYDLSFFNVLVYNMFTPLIFFIIRFNFLKLKAQKP